VQCTLITTKLMATDKAKRNTCTADRCEALEPHAWMYIAANECFASLTRLNDEITMGTQHRCARWGETRYARDVLLVSAP
jgi:hypothetical protein